MTMMKDPQRKPEVDSANGQAERAGPGEGEWTVPSAVPPGFGRRRGVQVGSRTGSPSWKVSGRVSWELRGLPLGGGRPQTGARAETPRKDGLPRVCLGGPGRGVTGERWGKTGRGKALPGEAQAHGSYL